MKDERISLKEKISYGLGDAGSNFLFGPISYYLLFFYTDIAGIAVSAVGLITGVVRVLDALASPFVGLLIDNTNTKWGKIRPIILFSTLPLMLLAVISFIAPDFSHTGKIVYASLTYGCFCLLYTVNNVSYTTLLSAISQNGRERTVMGTFKMIGGSGGGLIATGVTLPLVAVLGQGNQKTGFLLTALLLSVLAAIMLFNCFVATRERVQPKSQKNPMLRSLRIAFKSKAWIMLCVMQCLVFLALLMRNQSTVYYAKYFLNNEQLSSLLLAGPSALAVIFGLFVPKLTTTIGKLNSSKIGCVILTLSSIGIYFAGQNLILNIIFSLLAGAGAMFPVNIYFIMCSDTIDHVEWLTGKRLQGLMTAFMMMMVKVGIAASGILSSAILSVGGYVPNTTQTDSALFAIEANYIWIPALIGIVVISLSKFYDLDKKHDAIVKDLKERYASGSE